MDLEEKKERINAYIQTDRTDYVEFLNSLEEGNVDWASNSDHKNKFLEKNPLPEYENKWLGTGLYGRIVGEPPYQELDFEKFSYTVMKELVEDQKIRDTMKAVMSAKQSSQRKKLRVYLFECMKKPSSPYYNIEKYREILQTMLEAKYTAEEVIEDQGYRVVVKGFDSFGFLAETMEAVELKEKVNNELEIGSMDLKTYKSVVSFRNIGHFKTTEGEWKEVMTGGTPGYDKVKRELVKYLRELDFNSAHKTIVKARKQEEPFEDLDLNDDTLVDYNADLNEIKQNLDQSKLSGFQ